MKGGPFDNVVAVLELKEKSGSSWVSQFDSQADRWNDEYRMCHDRLFATADMVTATGHEYTKACMFRRNRYMVENADLLLAAYDGQQGGTAMTCEYAREMGVPVSLIMPLARTA